jgi:hypothetical protein
MVHVMVFSTYWSQASQIKLGDVVRIMASGPGFLPQGEGIEAKMTIRKNRGLYGSGVTDMLLQLSHPDDAQQVRKLLGQQVVHVNAQNAHASK